MSKILVRSALASFLILSSTAFADEFYFSNPGNVTWDGVYVNPYVADDNSEPQYNPLAIYCDDWNTDFSGNPTWNANIYALTASNIPFLKFGAITSNYKVSLSGGQLTALSSTGPDTFHLYLEAAWLDSQTPSSSTEQIEIAAAEWTLFVDPNHVDGLIAAINNSPGYADAVYAYLQEAQSAVDGGYTAPNWDVIVPVGNSFPMQEFLVDGPSVPEPSALILLGTVAGLIGFKLRGARRT